jgi:import inner membrane translocase subunit TIM50
MVLYRLYKPETQYHEGKHVRDLSKLNRDLSQVKTGSLQGLNLLA